MPPKGWTVGDVARRDKVALELERKKFTSEQAYAIATSQVLKAKKKGVVPNG